MLLNDNMSSNYSRLLYRKVRKYKLRILYIYGLKASQKDYLCLNDILYDFIIINEVLPSKIMLNYIEY